MNRPKIVLMDPKFPHNVGAILRAASCYGADEVLFNGTRVAERIAEGKRIPREERMRGYRETSLTHCSDPLSKVTGTPVAVELRENAECLFDFDHPDDAVYVFGPEDGSLGRAVLARCHRFVVLPTRHCLNLSAAVYTVLYDRALKRFWNDGEKPTLLDIEPVNDDDNVSIFVRGMAARLKEIH